MNHAFTEEWLLKNEYAWRTPGVAKFVIALANAKGVTYSREMEKSLRDAAGLPPRKLGDPPVLPRRTSAEVKVTPPRTDWQSKVAGEGRDDA